MYMDKYWVYGRSSASGMFATNNVINFEALIRKSIFAFITCLSNARNTIVCTIQKSWVVRDTFGKNGREVLYLGLNPLPAIRNFS